jgi:hypothetical protein
VNNPYICRNTSEAMAKYIYQHNDWTNFTWQDGTINAVFGEVRNLQGKIAGQMNALGFSVKAEATLTTLI